MANSKKIIEAKNIKNDDDQISFLKKHHPDLLGDNQDAVKDLRRILRRLHTYPFHIISNGPKEQGSIREEYIDRIKKLRSLKTEIFDWGRRTILVRSSDKSPRKNIDHLLEAIESVIKDHERFMPEENRGNKSDTTSFSILIPELVKFWKEKLGHEKFIYDGGNNHSDLANNFIDDFILSEYRGRGVESVRGLQTALRNKSDLRNSHKKVSRKKKKTNSE